MKNKKPETADCKYCGRTCFSFNKGILDHNLKAHEAACPYRKMLEDEKKDSENAEMLE